MRIRCFGQSGRFDSGLRLCHFGDFGQAALRREQRAAIVRRLDGPEADVDGLLGNGVSPVIAALTPRA